MKSRRPIPAALYFYRSPEDLRPAQVQYLRGMAHAHGWPVADDCIFVDSGRDDSVFKALGAAIDEGRATLILSADLVGSQADAQVRVEWLATRMTRYGGMGAWVQRRIDDREARRNKIFILQS